MFPRSSFYVRFYIHLRYMCITLSYDAMSRYNNVTLRHRTLQGIVLEYVLTLMHALF